MSKEIKGQGVEALREELIFRLSSPAQIQLYQVTKSMIKRTSSVSLHLSFSRPKEEDIPLEACYEQ